jgi:hypothetical protein
MPDGYISTVQYSIPLLLHYANHRAFGDSDSTELAEVLPEVISFLPSDNVSGQRSWTSDNDRLTMRRLPNSLPGRFRPLGGLNNE